MRMDDLISRQAAILAIEEYADRLQMVNWKENPGVPYKAHALNWAINTLRDLPSAQPEHGRWNNHEVACLIADLFGDPCACNFNGIDEWLPTYCDFSSTCCPNPDGVACWEQYLKHLDKWHDEVGE